MNAGKLIGYTAFTTNANEGIQLDCGKNFKMSLTACLLQL